MEGLTNRARARGAYEENRERIAYLRRFIAHGRVLDVGCSTGLFASQLVAAGYEVEGCDISPYACARAQEQLPGRTFHCGVIGDYAGRLAGLFDAITMMDVMEHLPDVMTDLRHLYSMLKPGGCLFVRTPTLNSPFYRLAESAYQLSLGRIRRPLLRAYHAEHLVFFDEPSIVRVLSDANFAVEDIAPDPLLWSNFRAAEMQGRLLENCALGLVYLAGRAVSQGHGMRVLARRR